MKVNNNIDRVKHLLKNYPHLRDNDNKLMANIWAEDMRGLGLDPKFSPAMSLLGLYASGDLTNSESIRRTRQKLQEEFPLLRGNKYNARQQAAKNVKQQLINTPEFYQGGTP